MGFCRRCGDIVVGPRCKCGGSAVAAAVKWGQGDDEKQDWWSRTYTKEKPPTREPAAATATAQPLQPSLTGGASKRFPRTSLTTPPLNTALNSHVSAYIASATSSRSTSPLKVSRTGSYPDEPNPDEGILQDPHTSELAKVYGSVLQPKETLDSYSCAICATTFHPDATIYPDPMSINSAGVETGLGNGTRFLCRPCFVVNGGSRGDCPACYRPVLILKKEGGFVESNGDVWHKKCFCCDGCGKNIGDTPMVDLLGRPSCAECFDTCLKRPAYDSPKTPSKDEKRYNLGGSRGTNVEREAIPALDELEQRLGITRKQETVPPREVGRLDMGANANKYSAASSNITPTIERLAARVRANSTPNKPPGSSFTTVSQYKSPEPDQSVYDDPGVSADHRTQRFKSPELEEDSSASHRVYSRVRSSDVHESSSRVTNSPRHSTSSPKPSEDAVEAMKRRFLTGSPVPSPKRDIPSSTTSSPRRRSRSRARFSDATETAAPPRREGHSRTATPARPALRNSASTSSLRSALRSQRTGETEREPLYPEPTGESTVPLRRDRTGDTEYMRPDMTGDTSYYLQEQRTGGRIRSQRTGDGARSLDTQRTGDTLYTQRTGDTDYTTLQSQITGDTSYAISRQQTGELRSQRTGESEYPLRPQRTGDNERERARERRSRRSSSRRRKSREGDVRMHITGGTQYGIPRQKTGETAIAPQRTGETAHGALRRQKTGDGSTDSDRAGDNVYAIRQQRTGEYVRSQVTGSGELPSQITGETIRRQKTGEPDYAGLSRYRTGDTELDSLVGSFSSASSDLMDAASTLSSSESTGSMSRIPGAKISALPLGVRGLRTRQSNGSMRTSSASSIPELSSDYSDSVSIQSSSPSTPPSVSPPSRTSKDRRSSDVRDTTPTGRKTLSSDVKLPEQLPKDAKCSKCNLPLFSTKHGGKFVTVPVEPSSTGAQPKTYHTACFTCNVCGEVFEEKEGGHAVFVRGEEGACHVRCAPPEKITLRKPAPSTNLPKPSKLPVASSSTSKSASASTSSPYQTSSRYERPPPTVPSVQTSFSASQPRFGGSSSCPGCYKAVSVMERGVVPGPQNSRWHASCLICGGQDAKGRRKEDAKPGCGKKLDSAAKLDGEGGVWCRECLLLLPVTLRQQSPVRSPIAQTNTGNTVVRMNTGGTVPRMNTGNTIASTNTGGSRPFSRIAPQYTGTTTIARQFTGIGSNDPALLRQLTGGGISPTRQLTSSPTKAHDGPRPGAGRYPRPKSVIGTRSTSGEGRGMFLVRQLTGGNTSFSGNEYGL